MNVQLAQALIDLNTSRSSDTGEHSVKKYIPVNELVPQYHYFYLN